MTTLAVQLNRQDCDATAKARAELEAHPAWHGMLSQAEAEVRLKGKTPFTYLVRDGGVADVYFVSFVKEDLSFEHDWIAFEGEMGAWCHRNRTIVSMRRQLTELFAPMMHVEAGGCSPLSK